MQAGSAVPAPPGFRPMAGPASCKGQPRRAASPSSRSRRSRFRRSRSHLRPYGRRAPARARDGVGSRKPVQSEPAGRRCRSLLGPMAAERRAPLVVGTEPGSRCLVPAPPRFRPTAPASVGRPVSALRRPLPWGARFPPCGAPLGRPLRGAPGFPPCGARSVGRRGFPPYGARSVGAPGFSTLRRPLRGGAGVSALRRPLRGGAGVSALRRPLHGAPGFSVGRRGFPHLRRSRRPHRAARDESREAGV